MVTMERAREIVDNVVGKPLAVKCSERILSGNTPPPNAPATQQRKGHGKTLVDTGETGRSIKSKTIIDSSGNVEMTVEPDGGDEVQMKFWANEMGVPSSDDTEPVPGQRIPTRSTLRKVVDEEGDILLDQALEQIGDAMEEEWIK